MTIRRALESDAPALSRLAFCAKAHWGYAAHVLERWKAQLTITPKAIREHPTFVALAGGEIAGFYSVVASSDVWELDNLWVAPEFMGKGIGRMLVDHALRTAGDGGAREVSVDADPNAEPFYLECGAVRRGAVAAPIDGHPSRVRPQLAWRLRP